MPEPEIATIVAAHLISSNRRRTERELLRAAKYLLLAATGPEGGPTSWAETRQRLIRKIDEIEATPDA